MLIRALCLPCALGFLLAFGAVGVQAQTVSTPSNGSTRNGAARYEKCVAGPPSAPGKTCTVTRRRPMPQAAQAAQRPPVSEQVARASASLPASTPAPLLAQVPNPADAPKAAAAATQREQPATDPAKPTERAVRKGTVPGELAKQLSEDMHPKQEHVLQSLPAKGGWTVIPLPAFSYARNESYWAGALVPILRANDKDELEDVFAPLYLHNKFINETFSLNYYGYRHETVQYRAVAAYATKVERHFELGFKDTAAGGGRYILAAEANWFKNAFTRFFGIGNRTLEENETTYTARETNIRLSAGINLGEKFSVLWTERFRDVRVENGIIPTLPQTKNLFPRIEGVSGAQLLAHRLSLLYDTRDNLLTPLKGVYVLHYWELGHNLIHNEPDRWVRFALDARYLMPHVSERMVFASRLFIDKVFSRGVPFYERPMLGGETTLRGFGLNRFIDDNLFLINLEERVRVFSKRVFDNPIEVEAAPFLDVGRVNRYFVSRLTNTQFNPGVGLRVISRPNVVGRMDVAHGKDGGNVFVGLDYPF